MPTPTDGVPRGSVTEQREWFWSNFSQELARAKAACRTDAERERLDRLRNGVLWLHNAIWNIHHFRLNAQPDALNEAATDLLLQLKKFTRLIPKDDLERLAAVHEQGFAASLGGMRRASFGVLCKDLALWHVQKLKAHRSGLMPLTPDSHTSSVAHLIDVQEGRCFYRRHDKSTGKSVADCSPDDVRSVNAAFDANHDFNYAGQVRQPLPIDAGTTRPADQSSGAKPVDDSEAVATPETLVLNDTASAAASALVQQAKAVYISYKCGDDTDAGREREAFIDRLDTSLQTAGYNVRRDKRDIGYKDLIDKFMDELARGHCIVVVLNNEYLHSRFCMDELVRIYLNHNFCKRIVPVVLPDVAGLTPMRRMEYVEFWREQQVEHQQAFALNLGGISHEGFSDFDRVRRIAQNCDAALSHIFAMNCLNQAQLEANDFQLVKEETKKRMEEPSAQAGRP